MYLALVKQDFLAGKTAGKLIACFDGDRSPGTPYSSHLQYDKCNPLRCNGPAFFMTSLQDFNKPPQDRSVFRFVHDKDRFALQGYPAEKYHQNSPSSTFTKRVTGNGYPIVMVHKVAQPVMELLGNKLTDPNFKSALSRNDQMLLSFKMACKSALPVSLGNARAQAEALTKAQAKAKQAVHKRPAAQPAAGTASKYVRAEQRSDRANQEGSFG